MNRFAILFSFICCFLHVEGIASPCTPQGEERQKSLLQWEEAMNWVLPFSSRTFSLVIGSRPQVFEETILDLDEFTALYGYFTCNKPLVGIVTESDADLQPLQNVFDALNKHSKPSWAELVADELLCKAMAYRTLQKGMKISIPVAAGKKTKLVEYKVDEVLDLWQGMPAFGLIPSKKGASPILLFRGTDFSFTSKSSWASILSDFDLSGAGLTTFRSSQKKIHAWLEKASSSGKTKVMGFSLGGILAIYTAIFENVLIDQCVAFNAPGVSKAIFSEWKQLADSPPIHLYATQGDLVSRFGNMVGNAFELSSKVPLGPIEAHTKIMTAKSPVLLYQIDVEKENLTRFRASGY